MIKKEFDNINELVNFFCEALENAEKKEIKNYNNSTDNIKVNYESSQEDLINRLKEQNRKYYSENNNLNNQVKSLNKALKEAADISDKLSEENKMAIYDSSTMNHCGDHPICSPIDLRRLEPSLIKRDTITVDKQQVIEGLFQ